MPQLSPMLGFLMSIVTLLSLFLMMNSLKSVSSSVTPTKLNQSSKAKLSSYPFFK
uniref:ATP synthase F0 subunit 8 n=1 Tax=Berthellina sp. TLT-2006 TaxID=407122 RepID=E6Y138_9GAST|nr:ATP synthase F0 subunit 8 [Berthellina sp. TLT-2006]ABK92224.1 ATP synthase F0 subunit 8 [Berthellina sp. TLT-2006]